MAIQFHKRVVRIPAFHLIPNMQFNSLWNRREKQKSVFFNHLVQYKTKFQIHLLPVSCHAHALALGLEMVISRDMTSIPGYPGR